MSKSGGLQITRPRTFRLAFGCVSGTFKEPCYPSFRGKSDVDHSLLQNSRFKKSNFSRATRRKPDSEECHPTHPIGVGRDNHGFLRGRQRLNEYQPGLKTDQKGLYGLSPPLRVKPKGNEPSATDRPRDPSLRRGRIPTPCSLRTCHGECRRRRKKSAIRAARRWTFQPRRVFGAWLWSSVCFSVSELLSESPSKWWE